MLNNEEEGEEKEETKMKTEIRKMTKTMAEEEQGGRGEGF